MRSALIVSLLAGSLLAAASCHSASKSEASTKPAKQSAATQATAPPTARIKTMAHPPATRIATVTDNVHGVELKDDYRWLEGDNSDPAHMGKANDEVGKWTDDQNAYTRSVLDKLPYRKTLEARLHPLMEVGSVSAPSMKGNRYFYSKREGTQNQASIFLREGYKGEPKLLLDPAKLDPSGLTTITWTVPSKDGKLLAYGTYRAGNEETTLHILEVDSGTTQPLEIPGKVSSISWLPDASGFVYRNLWDVKNPYAGQVMFHKMGTPASEDKQIYRQYKPEENSKLATTYGPEGDVTEDGKWLMLGYATDTRNNDLYVADFKAWQATGKVDKKVIAEGLAASFSGTVIGDTLYMQTTYKAPNGQIVAVDLKNPGQAYWKPLIPESKEGAVIQGFDISKDVLAVDYLKNASSTIALFDLSGKPKGSLKLPGIGSAGISGEHERYEAYLTFSSYNYPASIFRVDMSKPDAAEYLIQRQYTNSSKLAIAGGSNGGLLTGTLVTQRPDLFKAAIVGVPLLDMVRFQNFLMAKYWVPEYGSAEVPEQFNYIIKYSPYQNIKQHQRYPAVLLTAGENDSRVHPLHARKMAAALQAATTSDPATQPVLLWVDREAGHGQGKPLNLRIRDAADQRIFLMWQLGMLDDNVKKALP